MNICMLGWYGSETIGDRAILDGIMTIIENTVQIEKIFLGTILPFYTERMISEDSNNYFINQDITIELFCEKDHSELERYIKQSELVIMAGGPIIDLDELKIIEVGFQIAKKNNKKTALIGCGFGPFHEKIYLYKAISILKKSDVAILRDKLSFDRAIEAFPEGKERIFNLQDPAIVSVEKYKRNVTNSKRTNSISINYRNPNIGLLHRNLKEINHDLFMLIEYASKHFNKVILVPMHTFFWGGDDRYFYADLLNNTKIDNVDIVFKPLSLYETFDIYNKSDSCIGMRYHSIVLQTLLNGKNILLDYTERKEGKVSGFLQEINNKEYSMNRYYSLESTIQPELVIRYLLATERIDICYDYDSIVSNYKNLIGGIL